VTEVLPLGPFPSWGPLRKGGVLDLGAALRDQLLSRRALWGPVRKVLQGRLAHAVEEASWPQAAELLVAWLDTWPVGATVEPAVSEWMSAPSAASLAVLARASELVGLALAWPTQPGTPWPVPPAGWIREQVGEGSVRLLRRGEDEGGGDGAGEDDGEDDGGEDDGGEDDGSETIRAALAGAPEGRLLEEGRAPSLGLPPVLTLTGEALVARRSELARALVQGELGALRLRSPLPPGAAAQLALGELRMEGPHQRAFERYGRVGLRVDGLVEWQEILTEAPGGEDGPVLQATAEGVLTPGTPGRLARGEPETIGWLVWDAAFLPVPVLPVAVQVLRALDGERGLDQVAAEVGVVASVVAPVLDQLVALGAATAA